MKALTGIAIAMAALGKNILTMLDYKLPPGHRTFAGNTKHKAGHGEKIAKLPGMHKSNYRLYARSMKPGWAHKA